MTVLIGFLKAFLQDCEEARELYREMRLPEITEDIIDECLDEIPYRGRPGIYPHLYPLRAG